MSSKTVSRILDLSESLTPTEAAEVSGRVLTFYGVDGITAPVFLASLSEPDREELALHLEAIRQRGAAPLTHLLGVPVQPEKLRR